MKKATKVESLKSFQQYSIPTDSLKKIKGGATKVTNNQMDLSLDEIDDDPATEM